MSDMITPVILCGGSGTWLWSLSHPSYSEQIGGIGHRSGGPTAVRP